MRVERLSDSEGVQDVQAAGWREQTHGVNDLKSVMADFQDMKSSQRSFECVG